MMTARQFKTMDSVTEFTIFSLERSEVGLGILIADAHRAGSALANSDTDNGLRILQSLIGSLYDFRRFMRDVSIIFGTNLENTRDALGSFEDNVIFFRTTLHALSAALNAYNTAELSRLLSTDLVASLTRFRELLPLLRNRIEDNLPGAA